ncbi:GAF domain-containing protein [Ideonella sp. 4Y11]|uniref:GAF domain-containing protein n=1 Tax=Ideonella aquatica TaxID=2824119 RepID=A0A940YWG0_9BURK|nr:GAF domain-containing protein [Ideonella aquatica]MBQ0960490.1 GAF domain-containing protein [Ideonella aquatica]
MQGESPRFGQADLTNCERELIHLAGSVQPHGVLLVLEGEGLRLAAASENVALLLGVPGSACLGRPLEALAPGLAQAVQATLPALRADEPVPLQATLAGGAASAPDWEGALHRNTAGALVLELEPLAPAAAPTVGHHRDTLMSLVAQTVQRIGEAASLGVLADATARGVRELIGYDRVMVYKFDPEGHGEIIAESRDPRLSSLLGHHYPATDIPQRARELYLRNRVRVLVDVHYQPQLLLREDGQPVGDQLDMSMSYLRSMSPLHLQYLKNMGVTATLVVSLVHEERLWGLIAAHHDSPRNVRYAVRAACDLIGEVVSTRIAAIENYAHAQVAVLVRRLEQRLVEATSTEGDWRQALFRNPSTLLQPLNATGAVLFAENELLTTGEVPSTPELRALRDWVVEQTASDMLFASSAVGKANPALASLTPTASGVLGVRLSAQRPDLLLWLRKEQMRTVTWAGDPHKPMIGDDPMSLSPRRSFAAWSELVRGTAIAWTTAELALGRAFGGALVDIIVQVQAVRLLVAEHQLATVRETVRNAVEAVLVAGPDGRLLFINEACSQLLGPAAALASGTVSTDLEHLADAFTKPALLRDALAALRTGQAHWRGEMLLRPQAGDAERPVTVRAEVVPGRDGRPLGYVLTLFDRSQSWRATQARAHLEASLARAMPAAAPAEGLSAGAAATREIDPLLGAILTNASLAAMDIADSSASVPTAPMLEELESATRRATSLVERIRRLSTPPGADGGP